MPAVVHVPSATTEASRPKAPPVSATGPLSVPRMRPGAAEPETGVLKIVPSAKFQPR